MKFKQMNAKERVLCTLKYIFLALCVFVIPMIWPF